MRGAKAVFFGLILTLSAAGRALEHTSSDVPLSGTADARPATLRPQYVFNMRGRRDPFISSVLWETAGREAFNISDLQLKGFIRIGAQTTALFVATGDRAAYTLRGNHLYGSGDKPVAGVLGRFVGENEVRLQQGEQTLTFSALRASKRKI
jgi:hypothetical protein